MYVARVPNRNSPPAYLLREGWREGGKVKTRTLANLSHWPLRKIEALRRVLADEVASADARGVQMRRSLPHSNALRRMRQCITQRVSLRFAPDG